MPGPNMNQMKGPGRAQRGAPRPKISNPWKLLKRLMSYLFKYYGIYMFLVVICIVVSVIASVQGTLFTKTLIDSYIVPMLSQDDPDFTPLLMSMARVALFYAIGVAAAYIQSLIMVYVSQGTLKNLRMEMFEHMESLPIKYFDTHAHGDIMSIYTNDIDTLRQMISQSIPQLLNSVITIVSVFISMIMLSIPLTVVTIVMVIVILFVSGKATKASGKNFIDQQKNIGKLNGYIEEMMNGEKVVKVFCHEKQVIKDFDEYNENLFKSAYKANAFSSILGPINSQLGNVSYVICALVGGALAIETNKDAGSVVAFFVAIRGLFGTLSVGSLASFLSFNKSFSMPINQVSNQFNSIIMALAGADRIFNLLDEKKEIDEGYVTLVNCTNEGGIIKESDKVTNMWAWKHFHKNEGTTTYKLLEGDVTFNDVCFGYNDEKIVLKNINLHAKPGQKVALVGSTGAGKTTITNLINRFYDIQNGKIRYDDININKISKKDLRKSLGIVLQDTHLFTGTVADNIRFGKLDASDEEVIAAAKLANADGFIRRLPDGYETILKGDGANLSQGQRQLLAIARAAIANPPVLILDEATSSIDTRTEKIVQDGMDKLMHGRTTFVIAHRLSTIRNSDCILVMENGEIIERGNHEELLDKKGRYYELYTGKKSS